jgi:DNA-binding NarL/FixJ family response regulator
MKILIVDDHPLIRQALRGVLAELDPAVEVVEADNAELAMAGLDASARVDLVLLDLVFPGGDGGLSLLAGVRNVRPEVPVVVLSGQDDPATVRQALDGGAMGFISKRSATPVLVSALRLVLSGTVYIPPEALGATRGDIAPEARAAGRQPTLADLGLTGRQAEVLALLVQGQPNKVICRELGLAEGTVKTHVAAILRALNVSSRTQALYALSRLGVQIPFAYARSRRAG